MPLYEYECEACGRRFEVIRKVSEPDLDACTQCGQGPVRRLLSSPAIQFKGSGWYITDYAQKGQGARGDAKAAPDKGEGKKAADGGKDTGTTTAEKPAGAKPASTTSES